MGLYAMGKEAAIAAIKQAVNERVRTLGDGSKQLDVQSLDVWLYEQSQQIIEDDVSSANREAALGVLSTINTIPPVSRLAGVYGEQQWRDHPSWPTLSKISAGAGFVHAVRQSMDVVAQLALQIDSECQLIVSELPQVLSDAWIENGMGQALPAPQERYLETRFYVQTWVNDLGEESAPGPVSDMVEVSQVDVPHLRLEPPPLGHHIDRWRVYRSNTGTVNTAFQLVGEGGIDQLTGSDTIAASALGEVLPSVTWAQPPQGLRGICNMANGVIAGFFENTTAFCEPFVPYAWPVQYQLSCEHPIVAQAAFGQTLVRLHHGGVDFISGADSASMSVQKDVSKQVCASARAVCPIAGGVVFASMDGLCIADGSGVKVLTQGRVLRDDWLKFDPRTMILSCHEGVVYIWGLQGSPMTSALMYDLASGRIGTLQSDRYLQDVYLDPIADAAFGLSDGKVFKLFYGQQVRLGRWRSRIFVLEAQASLAWLTVESDFEAGPVTVMLWGDGQLRYTAHVSTRAPVRLPAGRWLEYEVEVQSRSRWNALTMASSGAELRGVR